jgi:two-component system, NtrC family, sensor histidine kinase PilS
MLGRLLVAIVLLGGSLLLLGPATSPAFTPRFLQWLIAGTFGASLLFAFALSNVRRLTRFAAVQLGWDTLMASGLVFVTGGAASGFTFLYGVVVLMAAIVLGGRAVVHAASATLAAYLVLGLGLAQGWIPHPPDQLAMHYRPPSSELGTAVLSNVVGLVLVGLLAGNLSTRLQRTGGRLLQAERSARSLARLNDHIVRSIASGLITTDPAGRVLAINPAGADMFGAPPDALEGRTVGDLLPVAGGSAPRAGDGVARAEGTATRLDGSTFVVGYSQVPLLDEDAQPIGSVLTFQDLTEVRALRETAERAERLAILGRLAAGLAHEIRNPLSSISGSVQLVRDGRSLPPEDDRLLGIVLTEADRLNDLVETMLQVGRPSPPHRQEVDLVRLTGDVVEMARRGPAGAAGVHIVWAAPKGPASATVDANQVRQVLWNLLKNAIQASQAGGAVHVGVEADEAHLVLEVRDQGEGIPPEEVGRLFDMFYSRRPAGVGLGLALVKQIVDGHGGTVEIDSTPGEHTVFRVRLPRHP